MTRQQTLLACLSITALVLGSAAQANGQAPFDELIVFGDSLSDTGNVFISFGAPPSPPYFNGRFSNGTGHGRTCRGPARTGGSPAEYHRRDQLRLGRRRDRSRLWQ